MVLHDLVELSLPTLLTLVTCATIHGYGYDMGARILIGALNLSLEGACTSSALISAQARCMHG
jgi:hypothetical protein